MYNKSLFSSGLIFCILGGISDYIIVGSVLGSVLTAVAAWWNTSFANTRGCRIIWRSSGSALRPDLCMYASLNRDGLLIAGGLPVHCLSHSVIGCSDLTSPPEGGSASLSRSVSAGPFVWMQSNGEWIPYVDFKPEQFSPSYATAGIGVQVGYIVFRPIHTKLEFFQIGVFQNRPFNSYGCSRCFLKRVNFSVCPDIFIFISGWCRWPITGTETIVWEVLLK